MLFAGGDHIPAKSLAIEGRPELVAVEVARQVTEAVGRQKIYFLAVRAEGEGRRKRVHRLAVSGNDFKELARKFSDLPSASEGGDIGVFDEDEMASYMRSAVTSLKPGEVSRIIETPVGFQFFKLLSSKEGGIIMQAPYADVKEEIREKLFNQALKSEFDAWIKNIRDSAYIRTSL